MQRPVRLLVFVLFAGIFEQAFADAWDDATSVRRGHSQAQIDAYARQSRQRGHLGGAPGESARPEPRLGTGERVAGDAWDQATSMRRGHSQAQIAAYAAESRETEDVGSGRGEPWRADGRTSSVQRMKGDAWDEATSVRRGH